MKSSNINIKKQKYIYNILQKCKQTVEKDNKSRQKKIQNWKIIVKQFFKKA